MQDRSRRACWCASTKQLRRRESPKRISEHISEKGSNPERERERESRNDSCPDHISSQPRQRNQPLSNRALRHRKRGKKTHYDLFVFRNSVARFHAGISFALWQLAQACGTAPYRRSL